MAISERAQRAMADAKAAGVTAFDGGRGAKAQIADNGRLLVVVQDDSAVAEIAAWTGTGIGNVNEDGRSEDMILITQWLRSNY